MLVEEQNIGAAENAIRDILFLYHDLITSYGGFGHGADCGSFDPFAFACVEIREPKGVSFALDSELLVIGSAVAILCRISDEWDETEPDLVRSGPYFARVEALLRGGALCDWPELREVMSIGLSDEMAFRRALPRVYDQHVLGFFRKLVRPR